MIVEPAEQKVVGQSYTQLALRKQARRQRSDRDARAARVWAGSNLGRTISRALPADRRRALALFLGITD